MLSASCFLSAAPPPSSASLRASAQGDLAATDLGQGLELSAPEGSLAAGAVVDVTVSSSGTAIEKATAVGPTVEIRADEQPRNPVLVRVPAPKGLDVTLTVGVLQEGGAEPVPLPAWVDSGYVATYLPHFSRFGFVTFVSFDALVDWLAARLPRRVAEHFGRPVDCPSGTDSQLVTVESMPADSLTRMVPRVTDAGSRAIRLSLCNPRRHYLAYTIEGAASASGFVAPQATVTTDLALTGFAGTRLVVRGVDSVEAKLLTIIPLVAELLPGASEAMKGITARDLSPLTSSTVSCFTPAFAASQLGASAAGVWGNLAECLLSDPTVQETVAKLVAERLSLRKLLPPERVPAYLAVAGKVLKAVNAIEMIKTAFVQIADELVFPPHDVSVGYVLTKAFGVRTLEWKGFSCTGTDSYTDSHCRIPIATVTIGERPWGLALNPNTGRVYAASSTRNSVLVVDGTTNASLATVVLGPPLADTSFLNVAVNPRTNLVYVAKTGPQGQGALTVVDGATNQIRERITVPGAPNQIPGLVVPSAVAVDPVTNRIYVATIFTVGQNSLVVLDGDTHALVARIPVGNYPYAIAVNSAASRVYVANRNSNSVTAIDGATNSVLFTTAVATAPVAVAVNSLSGSVYVASRGSNTLTSLDGSSGKVLNASASDDRFFKSPAGVAVDEQRDVVYVACIDTPIVWAFIGKLFDQGATFGPAAEQNSAFTGMLVMDNWPAAVAVMPTTHRVYAPAFSSGALMVLEGVGR